METSSRSRNRSSGPVLRSVSPGRFRTPSSNSSSSLSATASAFASSTSSGFHSPSSSFFSQRSTSPTRVNLYSSTQLTPSVRFSIDRPVSPNRSFSVSARHHVINQGTNSIKRTCLCSPTNHPNSFRCRLHKNSASSGSSGSNQSVSFPSNRLNLMRRSAMTNSLVRIGGVEGDLVRRTLTALIRPSSHQQRRRAAFEPRPSRLSVMSKAEDL